MRKLLLLNPPGEKFIMRDYYCGHSSKAIYYWPPIDLFVLSGILKKKYEIKVLDCMIDKLSFSESKKRIIEIDPDVIIFLTSAITLSDDMNFIYEIKKIKPSIKLAVLGDIIFHETHIVMDKYDFIDCFIIDFSSKDILNFEKKKKIELDDTKEFSYSVPKHELFPLEKYSMPYSKYKSLTTLLSNYGCPFNCNFCPSSKVKYKTRNIDNFIEELKYIQNLGIKEVLIRDFNFSVNIERTKKICREMIKNKIKLEWSCNARVDRVDYELLNLMKKAGCYLIFFGVESGDNKILKDNFKNITTKKTKDIFRYTKKIGISTLGSFIIGLPQDTKETINKTIKFSKEIDCDYASFNLFVPRHGSPYRDILLKEKSKEELNKLDQSSQVISLNLSEKELLKFHKKAVRSFYLRPSYFFRLLKNIKSKQQFFNFISNGFELLRKNLK